MDKKQSRMVLYGGMGVALAAALGLSVWMGSSPGDRATPAGSGSDPLTSAEAGTTIVLSPGGSSVTGPGAEVSGSRVTIRQGGDYRLTGSLPEGQIYVEAGSDDTVVLRLAGVEVQNSADAAIHVENAGSTLLWLEEGSENLLQSGTAPAEGVLAAAADENASGGAVYARDDLTIQGEGSLRVLGYLNNGIQTSNVLTVRGGSIAVEAVNNGVKGKDRVAVTGGSLDILAGGDGIKSDDTTGEGYGAVAISGGSFTIRAGGDGIQAETTLEITGGEFDVTTGGGSGDVTFARDNGWGIPDAGWDMETESQTSTKGFKCGTAMTIAGGTFAADCRDDALHSNGDITITAGELTAATGDDGIHADGQLTIRDGKITVTRSYEGLEGNLVMIHGGVVEVTASDDGINAYGGQNQMGGGRGGWGQGGKTTDTMPELTITGGTVTVNADGDGLDSNGNITVQGGTIIVNGPSGSGNGALDYGTENGGSCTVSGGTVLALGSNGMAESFGQGSTQYSFRHGFTNPFSAGDEIVILDAGGSELFHSTAVKSGASVVFSAPGLTRGGVYTLRAGDQTAEITLDSVSTTSGSGGMGFGGGRGGEGFGGRQDRGPRDFGGQPPQGMPQPPDGQGGRPAPGTEQ